MSDSESFQENPLICSHMRISAKCEVTEKLMEKNRQYVDEKDFLAISLKVLVGLMKQRETEDITA